MDFFHALTFRLNARWCSVVLLALGWPVLSAADCVDTRRASPAETEFHSRAMAALVAALSPVPVSGKLQNHNSVTSLSQQ